MERDPKSVWPVRNNAKEHTHSTNCIMDSWKNITKLQQLWRGIWNIFLSTFTWREKAHRKMSQIPLQLHIIMPTWHGSQACPSKDHQSPSQIQKFLSDSFACESVVLCHHAHLHILHSPFQLEDSLDYCLKGIVVFGLWHQPHQSLSLSLHSTLLQPTHWKILEESLRQKKSAVNCSPQAKHSPHQKQIQQRWLLRTVGQSPDLLIGLALERCALKWLELTCLQSQKYKIAQENMKSIWLLWISIIFSR